MKHSEDLLLDLARLHRIRASELELAAFQNWHRREVSPLVSKIWETAIERMHQRAGKLKPRAAFTSAQDAMPFNGPGLVKAAQGLACKRQLDKGGK